MKAADGGWCVRTGWDGKGGDEMGEEKKGGGGGKDKKGKLADYAKKKAMEWFLAAREADRLGVARDRAQTAHDNATDEARALADGLLVAFNTEDRIQTHRVFLPGDANVKATIVEVTTGSGRPLVRAHAVDFVAGG